MPENNKIGVGPGKEMLNFWGRVKDSRGNSVGGALVMLTARSGEKEEFIGHTYSSRQGFYLINFPRESHKSAVDGFRVSAVMGSPPTACGEADGRHRFYPQRQRPPVLECQIINYHRLRVVACSHQRQITVEAVPETVRLNFFCERQSGVRIYGILGRGYISSGGTKGEGMFNITICSIGEGLQEQEIIRIKTVPDSEDKKSLFFDSGSTVTELFN